MGITLKNNKPVTKNMTIKGDDGVGIKTITSGTPVVTEEKTTTPVTVTLTDETTQNFNVEAQNGSGGDNVLTKPTTAPSATQIVAVDNTNTQTMLNIGEGLSVENGSLKASGNSKLYYKIVKVTGVMLNYTFYYGYYSKNNVKPSSYEELKNDILGNNTGTIQLPLFVDCPQNDTKVVVATALKVSPSSYIQICFESSTVTDGVMETQYGISNRASFNPTDMEVFEI